MTLCRTTRKAAPLKPAAGRVLGTSWWWALGCQRPLWIGSEYAGNRMSLTEDLSGPAGGPSLADRGASATPARSRGRGWKVVPKISRAAARNAPSAEDRHFTPSPRPSACGRRTPRPTRVELARPMFALHRHVRQGGDPHTRGPAPLDGLYTLDLHLLGRHHPVLPQVALESAPVGAPRDPPSRNSPHGRGRHRLHGRFEVARRGRARPARRPRVRGGAP